MYRRAPDVFEDHMSNRAENHRAELFCVSYDLSKAYDSVQEYSIRAALERFSFSRPKSSITCAPPFGEA